MSLDSAKINQARDVLLLAQSQIISEIAQTGAAGGVGRAGNYAPTLVNITDALAALDGLADKVRMAQVRAAKNKSENE
jgi:hypothetical protein